MARPSHVTLAARCEVRPDRSAGRTRRGDPAMRSRKARLVTATALALCGVAATREADSYFTVALIPDTQNYTSIDHELNYDQMRYLVRARDSLKLAFVVHLGDLTDSNLEHEDQWDVAD